MRFARLAAILALLLASAGCASSPSPSPSPKATTSSGIFGITLVNHGGYQTAFPTPSPLPGGLGMSDLVPTTRADVLIRRLRPDGSKVTVAVIRSNRQGLFRIDLPPGLYVVSGTRIDTSTKRVVVTDGRFTAVRIQVADVF